MTNADREFDHGMTDRDIAFLLADAASAVEIGTAPTQAVIRGGRRRRARRWAVTAATAALVAGSTGALAVTALPGGGGHRVAPATPPATSATPGPVLQPDPTTLATGTDQGTPWKVTLDVWPAPRDETEAQTLLGAMTTYGEFPADVHKASDLVGRSAYTVRQSHGDGDTLGTPVSEGLTAPADRMAGTDLDSVAVPLDPDTPGRPQRLVVGHVARTAQEVTCTWKNGTTTKVHRATSADINSDDQTIRTPATSPYAWFVCLAPEGTAFESVAVTR
ncbi:MULTISPECIES: hypothetical protein [Streptomyces]|uniref:Uncharacterized protein n=2 Tax=Streptomyces TaxID=1883 RepID=A0A2U9P0C2_STRAS|nr:hypothetical protein [Streptomyces actuosus]AWT42972.1 hypothetical protein DMT42_11985 [Streptomyces actuosus]